MRRGLPFASLLLILLTLPADAQLDSRLRVSTTLVVFDTECGVEVCRDVTLENISAEDLILRRFISPQTPFSLDPSTPLNLPVTISPGEIRTLRFCFEPTFAELTVAQNNLAFEVDTGDAANLARDTLVLVGTGRSGSLVIEPEILDIGGILVGAQACRSITLRNDGNADLPLTILRTPGAPFSFVPPITGPLPPGAELTVDVCFDPTSVGRFFDTLIIANGPCRTPISLPISGSGMDLAPDIGPILQISPPELAFDTTRCGTTKCRDITIRNVGNTVSTLDNFDSLIAPFTASIPTTPIFLDPDSSLTLRICYSPPDAPRRDTQEVEFAGDSRYSLTIATVFDVSHSMDTNFGSFPNIQKKITAAQNGGRAFLQNLISDTLRGVVDTAAVYQFGFERVFRRLQDYSTNISDLVNAVPGIALQTGTCIYYAVSEVVADLRQQNLPGRRVIVLLTDGTNSNGCAQPGLAQIIAAAQAAGVRVYTIGIGDPGDVNDIDLTTLAQQTGGRYFFASDADALNSVYQQISEDLSKGATGVIRLTGEGTAPVLEIAPPFVTFDSVRADSSRCLDVVVRNVGNTLYPGGPLDGGRPPFATATPILPPIPPGDSVLVEICFGPSRLRTQQDTLRVTYNRCGPEEIMALLEGVGYDSVVVEMRDDFVGRPGSIVEIPIHLLDPLPALYEVDSIRAEVRFNKTMLAIAPEFIETEVTACVGMNAEVESADYSGDSARIGLLFTGGRAESNLPTMELAKLRFLVLLGNAMETTVEVTQGQFADGNPKVGLRNPALFMIDSLCYLPDRLLDGSARYEGRIKSVVTTDGVMSVACEVRMDVAAGPLNLPLEVELFDRNGRVVGMVGGRNVGEPGVYEFSTGVEALPAGVYYVLLRLGNRGSGFLTMIGVDR